MIKYKHHILFGVFCLAISSVFAQSFSLKQAQDYAEIHNYSALESQQSVEKSRAQVKETIASGLPQITGGISYQNFLRQPVQVIPAEFFGGEPGSFASVVFGTKQNMSLDLTASQLLFDGSYIIGLKAAKEVVKLSQMQQKLSVQEIKKQVYDAYALALAAKENYTTLQSSVATLEKIAKETAALKEVGLTDDISVNQLQINLSNLQNALENAQTQITLSKNLLKFHMGYPIESELTLVSTLDEFTDPQMDNFMVDQYSAQRTTEVRLARQNTLLQEFRLKAKKAGYLPTLSAFYNHQQNAFRQEFSFLSNTKDYFTTNLIGVNLSVPIFSSFKKHNQVKQSKIDYEVAQINQLKIKEGMSLEISNAQANLKNELNNYKTQVRNLELTELIREQTRTKFSEGLSSSFDINQAESQYLEAQAKYIAAIINLSSAKSTLDKLLNN